MESVQPEISNEQPKKPKKKPKKYEGFMEKLRKHGKAFALAGALSAGSGAVGYEVGKSVRSAEVEVEKEAKKSPEEKVVDFLEKLEKLPEDKKYEDAVEQGKVRLSKSAIRYDVKTMIRDFLRNQPNINLDYLNDVLDKFLENKITKEQEASHDIESLYPRKNETQEQFTERHRKEMNARKQKMLEENEALKFLKSFTKDIQSALPSGY